jgi:magnesium transporter
LIKKRAVWLMILFVEEFLTGTALRHYDKVLSAVATLAYYLPLLISTGGNSGSQSSSLIIRGIAVGEVKMKDWWRVLTRETMQGVVLGACLATVGIVRVWLWGDGPRFAAVIAITLICIVTGGCTIGGMLPLIINRYGFDPATSSTPFIASLIDVVGIVIYFNVAKLILAQVLAHATTLAH